MELEYIVDKEFDNINQILVGKFNLSTRLINKLIKNKKVTVNRSFLDTRNVPNIGDKIIIDFSYEEDNSNIVPKEINLNILYEDEWMLVINKPSGIAVHPSILHFNDSLSNGVRFYFDKIGLKKKIRPVNRLDLNTSGVIIFAKCEYIQEELSKQMQKNIFKKEYLCIVSGIFPDDKKIGTINLPIARKSGSIIERCVLEHGKPSITHYEVLKEFKDKNYSLVKCLLETGRTHQIRVHMKELSHPLLGDTLYGTSSNLINRQALHSYLISFIHPVTKKEIKIMAKLPKDMRNLL